MHATDRFWPQLDDTLRQWHSATGRDETPEIPGETPGLRGFRTQYPQRDSNPCRHLETVGTWVGMVARPGLGGASPAW